MKKTFLIAIICFCYSALSAQELLVNNSNKGMSLKHSVTAKENFYSIGRLYNVPAKEIAAHNSIDLTSGLSIGQSILIPLNASNFSQETANGKPIYYVVGQKEGLFRVSTTNNKVAMANLRKWNNLSDDNITTGQKLIVGYLVSPEANQITAANTVAPEKKEKVQPQPEKKEEMTFKADEKPMVAKQEPVEKKPESSFKNVSYASNDNNGGFFKSHFELQVKVQPVQKDETAAAGIFKTASGWQDAKYYALIDGVEPGTIIKVVNPDNNKAVYVKVLDKMTGIKQNQGYDVRISNAAATALDINEEDKFFVKVVY